MKDRFESKLSNLIGVSDTSPSKLGSCLTLENKNDGEGGMINRSFL